MPYFKQNKDNTLYYEIDGEGEKKVIMIMGFAGTMRMFDDTVTALLEKDKNLSILRLDNRGSGKSKGALVKQTTTMLGKDCFDLLNHIQWRDKINVVGVSLGGMIAQELALFLLAKNRLASLYLSVTSGKRYPIQIPFSPGFYKFVFGLMGVDKISKEKMLPDALKIGHDEEYLNSIDEETGLQKREIVGKEFLENWDKHMSWNLDTISAQSCAAGTHKFDDWKCDILKESGVPIRCLIATKDQAMPTSGQYELAKKLNASTIIFEGGHLAATKDPERYYNSILDLINSGIVDN